MKIFCYILTGLLLLSNAVSNKAYAGQTDTIRFRFASEKEARKLISKDDVFTMGWSEFDITSRLHDKKGTKKDLLKLKRNEVRAWTEKEMQIILEDMYELNKVIRAEGYRLPLPDEVILVKSTMKDEGNVGGYTQANWIALSDSYIERADVNKRRYLLLHELSHILTRNSFDYKQQLYAALGFNVVREGLEYPEELAKARISNPDIAAYDSYGPFKVNGKTENCAMYLYTDKPYDGGEFFEYVKIAFVPYDAELKAKRDADGKLIIYGIREIEDFWERIGKNTNYVIHPEEILAENFVLAFLNTNDIPTPELKEKVRQVLM